MLQRYSLQINQKNVYYWVRNPHCRQTVVMLHGFKGNHKGLTDFSAEIKDKRIILPDLPGYGESDELPIRHTMKHYADFLEMLFEQLNIDSIQLIGHSYGASLAIVYSGLHPKRVSDLVLISPAIPAKSMSGLLASANVKIANVLPGPLKKSWLASPVIEHISSYTLIKTVSKKRRKELVEAGLRNSKEQRPKVLVEGLESFLETPFYDYAQAIVCPSLIVAGETDIIAPVSSQTSLEKYIGDCRLEVIEEVGHLAPIEMPGTTASIVEEFWGRQSADKPLVEPSTNKEQQRFSY